MRLFSYILLILSFNKLLSSNFIIKPSIFAIHSSNGKDWMYKEKAINIFGFGISSYIKNTNWKLKFDYLQIGLLGNVNQSIFNFSPEQSYAYLDQSKDADGFWTEYIDTKLSYNYNNFIIELGKFNRHWGNGKRSVYFSDKAPSYPQIGFRYKLNQKLSYFYFHGFLNSNIPDSSRSFYYKNNFSQRSISIPRNIAAHQIEWRPNDKFIFNFNESVIYATRSVDIYYLIPILPFYPIENYIGDTDNIQMGFDILFKINELQKAYVSFFMDEFTPEWIFKSKNHNWFGWQFGYNMKDVIIKNSELQIEYNWTDQRIYMHKYDINDFYNHQYPLGFWAGPHAEELLFFYVTNFGNNVFKFHFSKTKRGLNSRAMVEDNYKDTQLKRYEEGSEERSLISIIFNTHSKIKDLRYSIELSHINFKNAGFSFTDNQLSNGIDKEKVSIDLGLFYNFSIKNN
tara:strand:+ start:102 stop:1466 length:1365 start_codon:yes stop_codon:yes gene_type:complete